MNATPLAAFLTRRLDRVEVEPDATYGIVGIRSFGRGVFARDPLMGSDTSYKQFNRVSTGQLVLSRLKGWEGAVAIVPSEFDGRYASTEFPTFDIDPTVADQTFVEYLCKWPAFWDLLLKAARGVGARRTRVKEQEFLGITVPMPNLDQQRVIGARLRSIDQGSSQALAQLDQMNARIETLVDSLVHRPDLSETQKKHRGWRRVGLGQVLTLDIDAVTVEDDVTYPLVGVYSFGRGLFNKDPVLGRDTSYKKFHRLETGQIVMSRLFAWEGAIAFVAPTHAGRFVSTEFPTFAVNESLAIPDFLQAHLGTETFWGKLRSEAAGVGVRRQRVNADRFLAQEVWLPPHDVQVATAQHLVQLRQLGQDQSRREMLEALVPSAINATFADFA